MTYSDKALRIVQHLMYENDAFSKWLDLHILEVATGSCTLSAVIRKEMLNGFQICHGGITFSIADSAFAFASNSHGIKSVSIETSISHTKAVNEGDVITAVAVEKNLTSKIGIYEVILTNQEGSVVAIFKGTVYRTGKEWEV
jgi:acyl-CoA thioesterase